MALGARKTQFMALVARTTHATVCLAILAVLTLAFNAKLSRETCELNERLAEYRTSREAK